VLVVELSNGQMVEDVRLTLGGNVPVEFYGRVGGNVPSVEELVDKVLQCSPACPPAPCVVKETTEGTHTGEKSIDLFSMVV
jgi:hypothetical protein